MRYLITIEYNGANYCGWQRQKNALSIQEVLEQELSLLLKEKITLIGSGRTDKGTHAINQKAHFDTDSNIPMRNIMLAVNTKMPPDIRIKKIEEKPSTFHAQHSATSKIYLYKYYVSSIVRPLLHTGYGQIIPPMDFEKMQQGSKLLIGTHDFKAFSSIGGSVETTTRTIFDISLYKSGDEIFMKVQGNGFLYKMVRTIAGTLADLSVGKLSLQDIQNALKSGKRKKAGKTFPACGLYLKDVLYD